LRAIQQEVRRIECKLDNPRTGLAEIKSEVAAIECAIRDLDLHDIQCKLNDLAEEVEAVEGAVDEVEDKLDNPHFGLEEIKEEIEGIERAVACLNLTPVLGLLNQVKHEVHEIECKLDNPEFGLEEIKEEVRRIECTVTNPETRIPEILEEVEEIEELLENLEFGLEEIKREVAAIECRLHNLNIQQILAGVAKLPVDLAAANRARRGDDRHLRRRLHRLPATGNPGVAALPRGRQPARPAYCGTLTSFCRLRKPGGTGPENSPVQAHAEVDKRVQIVIADSVHRDIPGAGLDRDCGSGASGVNAAFHVLSAPEINQVHRGGRVTYA
jgi:archaellum component FlaC